MKDNTKKLIEAVNAAHDWLEGGPRSRGGTELHSTDTCLVCGLARHWQQDTQNGVAAHYTFADAAGGSLPLSAAAKMGCAV